MDSKHFEGIVDSVQALLIQLMQFQGELAADPGSSQLQQLEKHLLESYIKYRKIEENILRQRAKQEHIKLSDDNSRYFHANINQRNRPYLLLLMHLFTFTNNLWVHCIQSNHLTLNGLAMMQTYLLSSSSYL